MRLLPRLLIVAVMFFLLYGLMQYVKGMEASGIEDGQLVPWKFGILALAGVTAVVTCVALLPVAGEFLGNFIFTPNQKMERSPHADALAKLAAGDFEGAIEEYKDVFDGDPQDTHAASEIVRLYCEKLNEPDKASDFLVEALSYSERTPEEIAFLSQRSVDVCWNYQRDGIRARAILIKIAEDMPETREAANALHRLQEIDRAINEQAYATDSPFSSELPLAADAATPAAQEESVPVVGKPPEA